MLPGKVLHRVCIARATVNESVCEDTQTEHVQFASAAVSTSVYTIAKVILEIQSVASQTTHLDTKYVIVKTRTGNLINTIATDIQFNIFNFQINLLAMVITPQDAT